MRFGALVAGLVGVSVLAGCSPYRQGPVSPLAAPSHAPYHARYVTSSVVKVFSGSGTGLVVGGGPLGRNPGLQMPGLLFKEHDEATHTYDWAFVPGVKLLDSACRPMEQAAVVALANTPGDISAVIIEYLGADSTQIAPAKVVIWNRAGGDPANCMGEEGS